MELPDAYVNSALLHLQAAVKAVRKRLTYDPSDIRLAQRVARLEIAHAICKTYCLDFPGSEWPVSGEDQRPAGVDGGSGAGHELAGSSPCSVTS